MTQSDELQHMALSLPLETVKTAPSSPVLSVESISTASSSSSTHHVRKWNRSRNLRKIDPCYKAQVGGIAERQRGDSDDDDDIIIDQLKGQVGYAQKGILETKGWFDKVSIDEILDSPKTEEVEFTTPGMSPRTKLSVIHEDDVTDPAVDAAHALLSVSSGGALTATTAHDIEIVSVSDDEMEGESDLSRSSSSKSPDITGLDDSLPQVFSELKTLLNPTSQEEPEFMLVPSQPSATPIHHENIQLQAELVTSQTVELKWRIEEDEDEVFRKQPKVELPTPKLSKNTNPELINSPDIRKGIYTGPVHEMCPIPSCRAVFCSDNLLNEALQHTLTSHAGSSQFVAPQKLYCYYRGVFHCVFTEHVECAMRFSELQEVLDHLAEDHGLVFCDYRCVVCSMRFSHETMLMRHSALSHNQTWWK